MAFCKYGVYDKRKPVVIHTEGCIDKCHGCGNLCPTGSITYFGDNTDWSPPNLKINNKSDSGCGGSFEERMTDEKKCKKSLNIDFLYLDLNTCERCMATDETLKEALKILSGVSAMLGYQVKLNSVNIATRELAEQYHFVSSPTIRVNDVDICTELKESDCADCGTLSGCSTDCRVFVYEGKDYEQPPTAMIIDGILHVLYGEKMQAEQKPYVLPENLKRFFAGKSSRCDSGCSCDDTQSTNTLRSDSSMKTLSIYEPALCCETGICGVGVDPELIRISTVINNLKKHGITVKRYNLNNFPQEFINDTEINKLINGDGGVDNLPATVLDGKIVKTKKYPVNAEIMIWLGIPENYLGGEIKAQGGCGCGDKGCCS